MKLAFPPPPEEYDQRYMADVLQQLEDVVNSLLTLETLHAAPNKPRVGMVAFADGTDWDPGSGTGAYVYAAAWRRMD